MPSEHADYRQTTSSSGTEIRRFDSGEWVILWTMISAFLWLAIGVACWLLFV